MAVAYDIFAASAVDASNSSSFSWSHDPLGTPRGVLVFVVTGADADYITSVTYNSIGLTQVSEAADTAGEPGRCTAFYLDSGSLTSSAVSVVVNRTANSIPMWGCSITVTAASTTEVHIPGIVLLQNDGTLAEQSVTDGSPGTNSTRFAAVFSGLTTPPSVGLSTTLITNQVIAAGTSATVGRETTAGQGSRSVGFSQPIGDEDRAAIHLAVREGETSSPLLHHPINRSGNGAKGRR